MGDRARANELAAEIDARDAALTALDLDDTLDLSQGAEAGE